MDGPSHFVMPCGGGTGGAKPLAPTGATVLRDKLMRAGSRGRRVTRLRYDEWDAVQGCSAATLALLRGVLGTSPTHGTGSGYGGARSATSLAPPGVALLTPPALSSRLDASAPAFVPRGAR